MTNTESIERIVAANGDTAERLLQACGELSAAANNLAPSQYASNSAAVTLNGGKVLVPAGALGRVIEPEYPRGVSVRWDVQHDAAGQIIHAGDMDVFERTCEVLK